MTLIRLEWECSVKFRLEHYILSGTGFNSVETVRDLELLSAPAMLWASGRLLKSVVVNHWPLYP